jgi:hypothetical protein
MAAFVFLIITVLAAGRYVGMAAFKLNRGKLLLAGTAGFSALVTALVTASQGFVTRLGAGDAAVDVHFNRMASL